MSGVDRTRLPRPGPEAAFDVPGADKTRLDNGLSLWTLQRGTIPLVTVMLTLPAGSWTDPDGRSGLAALTADMLDEGTPGRTAIEIQEALARLGAELHTDTGHDAVTVSLTLLQRHLAHGLGLLADIVVRPTLADADVARVRTLKLNRLRQLRDVPAALAERAFGETLYADHPYGQLPFGATPSLERLTREDVAAFHAATYGPASATLIVVGPALSAEVRDAAARAFGAWRTGGAGAPPSAPPVAQTPAGSRLIVVDRPGAAQTELRIGHVAVPRRTPDFHALLVLNAALGGQFVSRINLNLRERKGYTYGARTSFEFRRLAGPFSLATSVQTDATADAIAESLDEIGAIRSDRPITADELAMAQQTLTLGYPRSFESTDQVARALTQLVQHDLPDDTFAIFTPRVRAQDVASVTTAARDRLRPDELVVVAVGDAARIHGGLCALGLGEPRLVAPVL
jgi:zinc protease